MTLKNIPEDLYRRLKERAEQEHRSLNGQAITCLERALMPRKLTSDEALLQARALRSRVGPVKFDRDQIQRAIGEGRA